MSSALAALAGTIVGAVLSLVASWIINQRQLRAQWLGHDREHREQLYKEFIEQAAKCYVDALLHDEPDIPSLVILYAKSSRMRVVSSHEVTEAAARLIREIVETYPKPNKTMVDVQRMKDDSFDIIRDFSEACRREFDSLRAQTL